MKKRPATRAGIVALRESEARFRSLTHLSSDWYWEQDAQYRFTRIEGRNISPQAPSLIGRTRWESGLEVEGGWEEHRALLEARRPFFDLLMWRSERGRVRFLQLSGEPVFAADGSFAGYRGVGRDVTRQKRAEQILRLEHQVARALSESTTPEAGLEAVLHAVCETEGWGCGRFFELDDVSGEACFRIGWAAPEPSLQRFVADSRGMRLKPGYGLVGKVLQTGDPLWSNDTASDPRVHARHLASAHGTRGAFVFAVLAEGRRIGVLSFSSHGLLEPDSRLLQAARIIGSQVGQFLQRMRAEAALRESESRFRSLTQMSSDFYWETDAAHRVTQVSHEGVASGGAEAWAPLRAVLDSRQPFRELELGLAGGQLALSGEPRFDAEGSFLGYRGVGRDVTEIARARDHIASLAYSDALTGLANRSSLVPAFEQAVERARRRSTSLAAMFIDLDGFKQVNDAWGHEAGDRFLAEIGRRLRAGVRASDVVARLGGDEFFAVLEDVQEPALVEAIARKLLNEIARPVELAPGVQAAVTGSIGISMFPDDAPDVVTLTKYADRAMYEAKQAGKNGLRFHSHDMPSAAASR